MPLFRTKPKAGQHFIIVFDIGSASIGGAFVSIDPTRSPEIIFTIRRDIPFQEKLNFERFLASMISTLEEMFALMQKAGGGVTVDNAFCILASPWYASQTRLVHYSQPSPFVVTEHGLDKLIQKEIALFRESKLFAHSKVGNVLPDIMESKNIQMKLNGYTVQNPFGKKASDLEVALYISMIPANIHESINLSITKFWKLSSVHFSSFSYTAFSTIRDMFVDEASFLFVDISGEVTDISLVKDGVLLESISFPAGKNMLIRSIAKEMHSTIPVAISEMDMSLGGKSTREHTKQIEQIMTAATNEWKIFFEDALVQLAVEFPIPRSIFYTADDNITKWFEVAIREANFTRFSEEEGRFNVRLLGNQFLDRFVSVLEPDARDPFLAIETIFANKFTSLTKK
jgi:hypothetical protein